MDANTQTRIKTAAVLVPILLGLVFYGGLPFALFVAACMAVGLQEFFKMADKKGLGPMAIPGTIIPVLAVVAFGAHRWGLGAAIWGFGVLFVLVAFIKRPSPEGSIPGVASTIGGMIYVGLLLTHGVLLRETFWGDGVGALLVLLALAGSMMCDAAAFFIGKAYGKTKLIPHISPGKTVEGSIAGLFGGVLGVYLFLGIANLFFLDKSPLTFLQATALGLILAVAGMVGDLVESMMKRDAGVKDSGDVFPGHGGMLDRLDSPLFTLTATFYFMLLIK